MTGSSDSLCRALLCAWLLLFLLFGVLTIKTYPPVNYNLTDEVWAMRASAAYLEGAGENSVVTPRFYFASLGFFQKLFGGGIAVARLFSLLAATATLYLTYLLGRSLSDGWTGLTSSVLLGTAFTFAWHARIIRGEMLTAAFIVASVYLIHRAYGSGKGLPAFLGSLLAAISVNVHPNNLQYALAIIPVFAVIFRKRVASSSALYFTGGLAAGFAVWLAISYYPALSAGESAAGALEGIRGVWAFPVLKENFFSLFAESLGRLPRYYGQYVSLFDVFYPNRVHFWVIAWAALAVWGLSAFTAERGRVLAVVGLVALTNFIVYFITTKYGFWHMVELYPFLAVATALSLKGARESLPRGAGVAVFAAGVVFFVSLGAFETASAYLSFRGYDYERFVGRASRSVKGRAMAMALYAPAFGEGDFVTPWFNTDRPFTDCPPFGRKVEELGVEYIVVDNVFLSMSRKACGPQYEKAVIQYLELHCKEADRLGERYPSYWAPGGMISGVYVFRTPVAALQ